MQTSEDLFDSVGVRIRLLIVFNIHIVKVRNKTPVVIALFVLATT